MRLIENHSKLILGLPLAFLYLLLMLSSILTKPILNRFGESWIVWSSVLTLLALLGMLILDYGGCDIQSELNTIVIALITYCNPWAAFMAFTLIMLIEGFRRDIRTFKIIWKYSDRILLATPIINQSLYLMKPFLALNPMVYPKTHISLRMNHDFAMHAISCFPESVVHMRAEPILVKEAILLQPSICSMLKGNLKIERLFADRYFILSLLSENSRYETSAGAGFVEIFKSVSKGLLDDESFVLEALKASSAADWSCSYCKEFLEHLSHQVKTTELLDQLPSINSCFSVVIEFHIKKPDQNLTT